MFIGLVGFLANTVLLIFSREESKQVAIPPRAPPTPPHLFFEKRILKILCPGHCPEAGAGDKGENSGQHLALDAEETA